jgi:glucan 1,3-beta-glucosidase
LKIWADLHGAPGSENGFDNSGRFAGISSCHGWDENPANVQRTVDILTDIAHGIVEEGLEDVVTGFGVLNEPFVDCDPDIVRNYYNNALTILRSLLGDHVSVFVGDTFRSYRFNDQFWIDAETHHDTYLDSHPYHVFFEKGMTSYVLLILSEFDWIENVVRLPLLWKHSDSFEITYFACLQDEHLLHVNSE